MLFNSWIFLLFLLVTFALFYGVSRWSRAGTLQIGILIGASFVFYAFETPALLLLLLLSTLVNAMAAALLLRRETGRGAVLFLAVVFNLGTLAVFKYLGLFVGTFVAEAAEGHSSWWMEIPLPVGISFYTFQGLSLVIDLYRDRSDERFAAIRQLLVRGDYLSYYSRIAFFISFFPQLVAGPIVKASTFLPQIEFKRPGGIQWDLVVKNLILGFFLKMVVADNLKEVTVLMHYPNFQRLPQGDLFLLVFGYSFQIFADFAGYSLIAIGLGRLFGYRFPVNFNFPYIATSFSEFWRRWHISLSSWLRDYLYVPLGGNRAGRIRTYVNLFLVMLLGGLWHGAAWSYAVWGAAHGLFLAAERLLSRQKAGATPSVLGQLLRMTWVFTVVSFLWLLFVLPDFSKALLYFQAIAENRAGVTARNAFTVLLFGSPIVLYHVYGMLRERMGQQAFLSRGSRLLDPCVYGLLLWLIFVNSGSSGSFIYFQF